MTNIAELGIKVDSSDAAQATTELDKLAAAGGRAEKAADAVSAGFEKASGSASGLNSAESKLNETTDQAIARLTAMAKASLDSSEYYQRLTTSVTANTAAVDGSASSAESLAALRRRLQAESDALVGSTDQLTTSTKQAAAATGVQAEGLSALLGRINPAVAALDKLDQQQAELQKYKNSGLIDAETFREYSTRIDASRQKLGEFSDTVKSTGVSTAQTQAALRQLPAQFSDIFTSLAGGQNPLLVLIQQGGQIKDSFGGIGPTLDVFGNKVKSILGIGGGIGSLGDALQAVGSGGKAAAEGAEAAGAGIGSLAEGANTAADAGKNAKEAADALRSAAPATAAGFGLILGGVVATTAALVALGIAYKQGSSETTAYNTSLAMTGNTAGTTAAQLSVMAKAVSGSNGTIHEASASLAQLSASTRIPVTSFEMIAKAAANFEDATNKATSETVSNFEKIAKDPVKATLALNDSLNFLTASTYEQITSLERQGKTQEAATVASTAYAESLNSVSAKVKANLGTIESAWKDVADGAKGAWDAMLNVGREKSFADKMSDLELRIADFKAQGESIGGSFGASLSSNAIAKLEAEKTQLLIEKGEQDRRAAARGAAQESQQKALSAAEHIGKVRAEFQSNEQKREKEIADYRRNVDELRKNNSQSALLDEKKIAQDIQNIKDKYKDPKAASPGAVDLTAFNAAQNQLKSITGYYDGVQKELEASQKAGLVSAESYASQRAAIIEQQKGDVTSAYEAEIAALEAARAKASTSAEQRIQLDQKIADARTSMVEAQKKADSELSVLATSEAGRLKKQELAVSTYTSALEQQVKTLRQQGQRSAATLGMGDRQRGLTDQQNSVDDRINQQKVELANQYGDGSRGMSLDEYNLKLAALNKNQQDLRDTVQANYDDMTTAQNGWSSGASSAFQDYLEQARDVAGQTKTLFTNAFDSMDDSLANFVISGKFSFSDFTKSVLSDMARIATRQASSALLGSLFGAATSYFGGGASAATSFGSTAGSTAAGYSDAALSGWSGIGQAKGGAWSGGVQMFANGGAFTNSIVSKPTAFGIAGGGYGVMGEAGDEAIMPLTRTAGGQLGVRALGGGGGSSNTYNFPVSVSVQTSGESAGESQQVSTELGKGIQRAAKVEAETAIARAVQPGGSIWRLTNGRQ
ncbi:phage tail tape measure protein [Pseudomonas cannabina]|uniref:Phage tail tape measure protein lambda n=1 Tax=Pseudomonas cannabina TaxID=86840 RepID=A0A0P9M4U9_PSECA|nr:phage tail tape measure protein [Pseudomonas cannabina]KAA8712949.1 phage tail tape measure protein [Pseudomonas cannabina]KPW78512.1 Phage tail tape measure protein lambda [Pseudomonas cannabina]RMN20814.1 Phage tail tape measure protein lambda [Pseudomonas cannabina]SDR04135.1 phage tail tape measure protein, lambda family [Pseudomonas cannabina]